MKWMGLQLIKRKMQDRLTTKRSGGQGRTGVFIIQRCGRLARRVEGCNWTPDRHLLTRKITALSFLCHLQLPLSSLHNILIFWLHFCCIKLPKGVFVAKFKWIPQIPYQSWNVYKSSMNTKLWQQKSHKYRTRVRTSAPTGILSGKGIYMDFPCHSGE